MRIKSNNFLLILLLFIFFMTFKLYSKPVFAQSHSKRINILFVLDASGSMADLVDETSRLDIAKSVILTLVRELKPLSSDQLRVGLRIYGHQGTGCQDSQLEIPLMPVNMALFDQKLASVSPVGSTPIANALRRSIQDLPKGESNSIILLTDGGESCEVGMEKVAQELQMRGISVHVVGYQITGSERQSLIPLYATTNGGYFDVKTRDGLNVVLKEFTFVATGLTGISTHDPSILYQIALEQYESQNYLRAKQLCQRALSLKIDDKEVKALLEQLLTKISNEIARLQNSIDVNKFVSDWKKKWEMTAGNGNIDAYQKLYDPGFYSRYREMNFYQWMDDKSKKGKSKQWIKIEIKNIKWEFNANDELLIGFEQIYRSNNYADKGLKYLYLKIVNGKWIIFREEQPETFIL